MNPHALIEGYSVTCQPQAPDSGASRLKGVVVVFMDEQYVYIMKPYVRHANPVYRTGSSPGHPTYPAHNPPSTYLLPSQTLALPSTPS